MACGITTAVEHRRLLSTEGSKPVVWLLYQSMLNARKERLAVDLFNDDGDQCKEFMCVSCFRSLENFSWDKIKNKVACALNKLPTSPELAVTVAMPSGTTVTPDPISQGGVNMASISTQEYIKLLMPLSLPVMIRHHRHLKL